MPFLPPNQQRQSTEGKEFIQKLYILKALSVFTLMRSMRGMMKDTSIDKEKLINIVKQHEFLHNKDNPVYKNIMCMFHLYYFLFTAHI